MKFQKNILKTLSASCLLVVASSCSLTDFGDINKNPNSISVPVTSALLTNALNDFDTPSSTGSLRGALYCQYFAETQYTDVSLYSSTIQAWDGIYAGSMYDLQNIIKSNTDASTAAYAGLNGSNNNQIALARILKAYRFLAMTDSWGDMPASEALQEKVKPKYDTQQEIYTLLFKELKEAVSQFDGGASPKGDIVHNGNLDKWRKFANTVRLVMALRISKIDPTTGKAQFLDALSSKGGIIETNEDNTAITYPGGTYKNPWFNLYDGRKDYAVSDVFAGILTSSSDPRIKVMAQPNSKGDVVAFPYGLTRDDAVTYANGHSDYSFVLASSLRQASSTNQVLTASHAFLARAEAAQLGWTTENAKNMYNKGIEMSWKQWGVFDQAKYNTFIALANIDLATDPLTKIQLQRYVAFYPNGHMGWAEWRRTGVPALVASPKATNASKKIPRRYMYGANEPTLNGENFNAAVGRINGGDTQDGKVWWDK
jgi:Starch-binding associating with outer membrane